MRLHDILDARFGDATPPPQTLDDNPVLQGIAARGSCRHFTNATLSADVIQTLCAVALASPSKSDLQQRDIIVIEDRDLKAEITRLMGAQAWIEGAPHLLVFCGNNRRLRQMHVMRGHDFANDHLDAFFNAGVDAGIALSTFMIAAEAAGYGCCPISTIRNAAARVSDLLALPDHVFPVAGLALGVPAHASPRLSMRLPLRSTVHVDSFDDREINADIARYDAARPMTGAQRAPETFGQADRYTWSEDKTRQYSRPERDTFGTFIRDKGFHLD